MMVENMNLLSKFFVIISFLFFGSLVKAENIKLFIHVAGGEPHKYALSLKPVAQKSGDNLIIEIVPGVEFSGPIKAFKNEKGPALAIVSGTTLAKGIKEKKYKLEDYSTGNILFFSEIGLTCKKPCAFKSFEDVIGTTQKTLKIGASSVLSKGVVAELKKEGVKAIMIPYSGGWPEMVPDLMSGTLDLVSIVIADRKNDNIVQLSIPEKYGIQTKTWMVLLYKNIPQDKFLKWYNDEAFVSEMKIPKTIRETDYVKLLNETVKTIK